MSSRLTTPATMNPSPVSNPLDDATILAKSNLDQIRNLLDNAERRMQGERTSITTFSSLHHTDHALPKWVSSSYLNGHLMLYYPQILTRFRMRHLKEPSVKKSTMVRHQDVAHTDVSIQRSANYDRKVEDPITQKKRRIQVRFRDPLFCHWWESPLYTWSRPTYRHGIVLRSWEILDT